MGAIKSGQDHFIDCGPARTAVLPNAEEIVRLQVALGEDRLPGRPGGDSEINPRARGRKMKAAPEQLAEARAAQHRSLPKPCIPRPGNVSGVGPQLPINGAEDAEVVDRPS